MPLYQSGEYRRSSATEHYPLGKGRGMESAYITVHDRRNLYDTEARDSQRDIV